MTPQLSDTLRAREQLLEDEFSLFDVPMDRYELLIDKGRALPELPEAEKVEAFRVRGCQSQVWIVPDRQATHLLFRGDSDALITRGLVAVVTELLTDLPPEAVAAADLGVLARIGLDEHLSPTRKNGLAAMIARMKAYAQAVS